MKPWQSFCGVLGLLSVVALMRCCIEPASWWCVPDAPTNTDRWLLGGFPWRSNLEQIRQSLPPDTESKVVKDSEAGGSNGIPRFSIVHLQFAGQLPSGAVGKFHLSFYNEALYSTYFVETARGSGGLAEQSAAITDRYVEVRTGQCEDGRRWIAWADIELERRIRDWVAISTQMTGSRAPASSSMRSRRA